jgi:hypothetical protein
MRYITKPAPSTSRRAERSKGLAQVILSVIFGQQSCKLKARKFTSWNQRFWVDVSSAGGYRRANPCARHPLRFPAAASCSCVYVDGITYAAIGIGATTAIFTLTQAIMLRSLPVADPAYLYRIGDTEECCVEGWEDGGWSLFSYQLYQRLAAAAPEFEETTAFQSAPGVYSIR